MQEKPRVVRIVHMGGFEVVRIVHITTVEVVRIVHFKRAFDKRIGTQYVLHPKQMKTEDDRVYLPLYMAGCL